MDTQTTTETPSPQKQSPPIVAGMEIKPGGRYWLQVDGQVKSEREFQRLGERINAHFGTLSPPAALALFRGPLPSETPISPWAAVFTYALAIGDALWQAGSADERTYYLTPNLVRDVIDEQGSLPDQMTTLYGEWPIQPTSEGGALVVISVPIHKKGT